MNGEKRCILIQPDLDFLGTCINGNVNIAIYTSIAYVFNLL